MDPVFMQDAVNDLAGFLRSFSAGLSVDGIPIGFPATLDRSRRVVVQAPSRLWRTFRYVTAFK